MRVATWNLWWRFGPWEQRQPAIKQVLEGLDVDVLLLQEVYGPSTDSGTDQARELAAALGMHWIATTETNRTSFDGHTNRTSFDGHTNRTSFGCAILSRWPIVRADQCWLPAGPAKPPHRSALWALLDHPDGPQPVATTHLDWRYDNSRLRQRQIETLVTWLAAHHLALGNELGVDPDQHRPLILGGDFNAVPESDEMRRLFGLGEPYANSDSPIRVFTDLWAACGDGPGHTWTRDNEHAADAQWPRRRLDYLLVSWPRPKPTGNPLACCLTGLEPVAGVVPSDHACVVGTFDDRPAFASTNLYNS